MDKKVKQAILAQIKTVETLLRQWDPIGVFSAGSGPMDEYDSYAPHIVTMVHDGCTVPQLSAHLSHLRTEVIGMPENEVADQHTAKGIIDALQMPFGNTKSL